MRKFVILPALLCVSLTESSCATPGGGPLGFMMFDPNHHVAGAEPLFSVAEDQCITASFLLAVFSRMAPKFEKPVCTELREQIQRALPFDNLYTETSPKLNADQRNAVVTTLVLASNKRCGDYVRFLQTYQGNIRATSGIASQALATLATLATGNTAQWLAAGSAFSTGAGNTTYEVHFANKTVAMLTKAFDTARLDRLQAMQDRMQCTPAQYPLPQAMGDVFDYHTSCSLTTGLMQAQDAVEQQRAPNLETLAKIAEQVEAVRGKLLKLGSAPQSQPTAGTASVTGPSAGGGTAAGGGAAAGAAVGSPAQPTANVVATASQSTGTGGSSPPLQTHVPACPFNAARTQTGLATPDAKAESKAKKA